MITPASRALATVVILAAIVLGGTVAGGAQQMPDPKEIAGIPLPVGDVPSGTVIVRVIRGSLSNNIAGQPVDLLVSGAPRTMKTDTTGRASFPGLAPGIRVKAIATVGAERLESQEFPVPAGNGVRLLLVATDPDAVTRAEQDRQLAAGPAQQGSVVLGDQSRFVFELGDGSLSVFNLLQIVNTARAPVQTAQPIVFELPDGATGATVIQGSSSQATAANRQVTVVGPFAPGATNVQFAYSMPYSSGALTVAQAIPVPLSRVTVLAQKIGEMRVSSAQVTEQRNMSAEGQAYIVGQGPAVRAGDVVAFQFEGLPYEPRWPRYVALTLAIVILAAGAWASRMPRGTPTLERATSRLETKRNQLFTELASIERQHREGRIDPAGYASRRAELVAALERVYAEIDRQAA
jgi:hypothetical protein